MAPGTKTNATTSVKMRTLAILNFMKLYPLRLVNVAGSV
jgi:hypothetical protein